MRTVLLPGPVLDLGEAEMHDIAYLGTILLSHLVLSKAAARVLPSPVVHGHCRKTQ
jgi:hypothetical protein